MSSGDVSLVDALRQEEYTGADRCLPCTIANAVIAVGLAALAKAIVSRFGSETAGRVTALVLTGLFAAAIYLRGYLVPGTPELTKRYFPDEVLRLFDKHPAGEGGTVAFDEQIAHRIEEDTASDSDDDGEDAVDIDIESTRTGNGAESADTSEDSGFHDPLDPANNESGDDTQDAAGESDFEDPLDPANSSDSTETETVESTEAGATERTGDKSEEDDDDGPEFETIEKIENHRQNAVDPEEFLQEIGAVGPCEDRDDLCLTDEFASTIEAALGGFDDREDVEMETLAELFDADVEEIEPQDREYPAYKIGRRIRKWATDGALVLDIATHQALRETSDRWMDVPLEQRADILESLRTFRESCPSCDGDVAFAEELVASCCSMYEVIAYKCQDCGQHLVELDPTKIKDGKGVET